jgi:hypothetical protein
MAVAYGWAWRVMTISLEMALPGMIGYWLDQRLGTGFVLMLLGFAGGMTLATAQLMKIAAQGTTQRGTTPRSKSPRQNSSGKTLRNKSTDLPPENSEK